VKTRIDLYIGTVLTLSLYRAFLTDTLIAARLSGATVFLALTPGPSCPEQRLADVIIEQHGDSFGERFDGALRDAADELPSKTPLILIGADTPHLSPKLLREALGNLRMCDAVVGPNVNGGFYLLGFSSRPVPVSKVFSYSSKDEPRELARLLQEAHLRTSFVTPQFDVDLPQDLVTLIRLIDSLEGSHADWIPKKTQNVLNDMASMMMKTANHRL
jgi:glycosyltransferase A (GT-A) superfamily protein (DUF2064 family)